eukprot:11986514-Karenia_brevis.AAC.1
MKKLYTCPITMQRKEIASGWMAGTNPKFIRNERLCLLLASDCVREAGEGLSETIAPCNRH